MKDGFLDIEARELILNLFSSRVGLPIILVDEVSQLVSSVPGFSFIPYCAAVKRTPSGFAQCMHDHKTRALEAQESHLSVCHAGISNYVVPTVVGEDIVGALLCGQMKIEDSSYMDEAQEKHKRFLEENQLSDSDRLQLAKLFEDTEVYSLDQVNIDMLEEFRTILEWIYRTSYYYEETIAEREQLERRLEELTHEMQIRLQGLVAQSENLWFVMEQRRDTRRDFKRAAKRLLDSIEAFDTMIQNLGSFMESTYRLEKIKIAPVIHNSCRAYRTIAQRKGVKIKVDLELIDGKSPVLEISRLHIRRMLDNLVENAVKYSYSMGRSGTVKVTGRHSGAFYSIAIQNLGVGIYEDEFSKIFEKGYKGRLARDAYRTGAGMGLYIVKDIVDKHFGKIEVSSIKQRAAPYETTFTVYLPYEQPHRR